MVSSLRMWKIYFVLFLSICLTKVHGLPTVLNVHSTSVGKETVTLSWTVSGTSDENYRNEIVYLVYDEAQNPNTRSTRTVQTAKDVTTVTINGLRSGTTYEAQIHTKTDARDGPWSTKVLFATSGVRPPRTLNLRAITDTTATVEWTPPIGVTPEFYVISLQRSDDPNGEVPKYPPVAHPASELTLWNLKPETPYSLYIQTRIGEELSTKMKDGFRTNTPTVLKISNETPEETSVVIKWETTHTRYDIARYDVEIIDVNDPNPKTRERLLKSSGNQEVRQLLVEDLKPAKSYSYRVRAIYRINGGRGQWSEPNFFTAKLPGPPARPTGGEITKQEKTSAIFRWKAPQSVLPIISYEIQYGKKDERPEPIVSTSSTAESYVLSYLESGTLYTVRTRALALHNLTGNWSVYTTFTTNGPKPASSISITEITDSGAKVSWTTYTNETADQIKVVVTETSLQTYRQSKELPGNEMQLPVTGLKAVTGYLAEVVIIKGGEESSVKSLGFATNTNLDVLSKQPKNAAVLLRSSSQSLSELHYEFDKIPNVVIKYYTVNIRGFDNPNVPFDRTQTFPPTIGGVRQAVKLDDIQSGYEYKIRSRGVFNDGSEGKWSTIIATIVGGPRPVRAINMRSITHSDVTVNWQSGYDERDANYDKQEYTITLFQYGEDDTSKDLRKIDEVSAGADQNEVVFEDKLEPSRRYSVQIVTIISSFPNGEDKSTTKVLAFRADSKKLEAPMLNDIHIEKDSVTIFWNRLENRKDIKYYEVKIKPNSGSYKNYTTSNGLSDSYTFTDLDTNNLYFIRVRAVDSAGTKGPWLEESLNLNNDLQEQVEQIKLLKKSSTTATLSWKAPKSRHLKMYEIELWSRARNVKEFVLTKVLTSAFKLEDLHPGTSYSYRVRTVAMNENIKGPWSGIQTFSTQDGSEESSMNSGIIIAVIIAAILLIIVVVIIVVCCKRRRSRNNQNRFNVRFSKNDDIKEIA